MIIILRLMLNYLIILKANFSSKKSLNILNDRVSWLGKGNFKFSSLFSKTIKFKPNFY